MRVTDALERFESKNLSFMRRFKLFEFCDLNEFSRLSKLLSLIGSGVRRVNSVGFLLRGVIAHCLADLSIEE